MKILYIEDDYSVLINKARQLFGSFLSDEEREKIKCIAKDEYAGAKEIKDLLSQNHFLSIEYNFLDALKYIESGNADNFDFFVFDRDLGTKEQGLTVDNIKEVFPKFTQNEFNYIYNGGEYGREGDYLLKRLYSKLGVHLKGRIFFLSAYPSDDVFQDNDVLRDLIDEGQVLTKENYIDKADPQAEKRLKDLLEADEEEILLCKKWSNVLAYFDHFSNGKYSQRMILDALKNVSLDSSCKIDPAEAKKLYFKYIFDLQCINKRYFWPRIERQNDQQKDDKYADPEWDNAMSREKKQKWENEWYTKAEIPRNIVETCEMIRKIRNNCEHDSDQKYHVDLTCLTILAAAYALLELSRFFFDKGIFDPLK